MEIRVDYYKLVSEKKMGDGNIIPQNQELLLIKRDVDDMLFFETHNDEYKKLFWANYNDVEFIESFVENWSDEKIIERNNYINGKFI